MCVKGYISFNVFLVILTCVILGPQILFAGSQCCTSANLVHLREMDSMDIREEMENLFLCKTRRNVTQNIFYTHTHTNTNTKVI